MSTVPNRKIRKYKDCHRNINGTEEKLCSICGEWFELNSENFYKNKSAPDGYFPYCIKCTKIKANKWAKANPEKTKESKKKDKLKPHRLKEQQYYSRRDHETGYYKRYISEHREKFREYTKNRQNKNHKISQLEWTGCKKYFNNKCAYCEITEKEHRDKYKQDLHKEHAIHDGANDLSNCIPACKSCNSLKAKRSLNEWYNKDNERYSLHKYNKIVRWLDGDYKKYKKNSQ